MENKQTGSTTVEEAEDLLLAGTKDLPTVDIKKTKNFSFKELGIERIC